MNRVSKLGTTLALAGVLTGVPTNIETAKNNTQKDYGAILNVGDSKEQLEKRKKEIIIKGMDDDLKSGEVYNEIKGDLKYDVVGNIGVVIYKGFPDTFYRYSKDNGVEYYTNVPDLMDDSNKEDKEDLEFAFNKSGIIIKGQQIFKNGKEIVPFLDNGNISPDFVKMVDDISFYKNTRIIFGAMKSIMEGEKIKSSVNSFRHSIVKGVLRIKDVMFFYSKGYIREEYFLLLLKRAIQELPNQCSDLRFNNLVMGERDGKEVTMEVTKNELDEYLNPTEGLSLITKEMYDDCLERIKKRDEYIGILERIEKETKGEVENVSNH